jgi:hypothetical protein
MARLTKERARKPIIENGHHWPSVGYDAASNTLTFRLNISETNGACYTLELTAAEMLAVTGEWLKRASASDILAPKPKES